MMKKNIDSNIWDLEKLSDPKLYHAPIDIDNIDSDKLISNLKMMYKIRFTEQKLAISKKNNLIGGPVHLGVGQEAIAVGVSANLTKKDKIFGAHRSHSHILAQGSSIRKLFSETLGRDNGLSKGMGGSMHLCDVENGFIGSVPIVAGTVSLAVGAGIATKLQNSSNIAVAYFGDGAAEEGTVHESMNLAKVTNSQVLFVVENNLLSSHMYITQRQPLHSIARFAYAHDITFEIIDGNNVIAVKEATERLVKLCREGKGPVFLEAITYRWYGHVDWYEDIDVGMKRSKEEIDEWKKRDPIKRLVESLIIKEICTEKEISDMKNNIKKEIDELWNKALEDKFPDDDALLKYVYSNQEVSL